MQSILMLYDLKVNYHKKVPSEFYNPDRTLFIIYVLYRNSYIKRELLVKLTNVLLHHKHQQQLPSLPHSW